MVSAWIALAQGRRDEALQTLRAAADREDSTEMDPVTPAHVISARQLLGDMLLEIHEPEQALQAFEAALKREPGRFWTLFGAARAANGAGDWAKTKAYYSQLVAQTEHADSDRGVLKEARAFLAGR
jgi:tetratricopeptide (TPR) repeat protein